MVEIKCQLQFVGHLAHLLIAIYPPFDVFHLLHLHLRSFRIIPEVWCLRAQFFLLIFHLLAVDV